MTVEASTLEEIRQKVKEYFMSVRTLQSPRVMELFQKLNKTLENPNSDTKQTVSGDLMLIIFSFQGCIYIYMYKYIRF